MTYSSIRSNILFEAPPSFLRCSSSFLLPTGCHSESASEQHMQDKALYKFSDGIIKQSGRLVNNFLSITTLASVLEPCADVIVSAPARRSILVGGGGAPPVPTNRRRQMIGGGAPINKRRRRHTNCRRRRDATCARLYSVL